MNVTGFPFRLQIYDDFLKEASKIDENQGKWNANVCIIAQSVWEHNFGGGELSAWYLEK